MAKKLTTDELVGQALDNEKRDMIEDILENPAYGKTIEERIAHAKKLLNTQKAAGSMTFEEWLKENPGKTEEDFKAEFKKFRALAEMNDLQKSHFNSLTTDVEKAAFIAMSSDERNTTVEMIKSMDEEYVTSEGVTLRKSRDGASFDMLKSMDQKLVKMENERKLELFQKVATSETREHLPGETVAKARALQAIAELPEAVQKTINEMLNAGNDAMKESLTVKASHEAQVRKGEDKLDSLAKAYAKENSVSYSKAYDAILDTPEGMAAYNESLEG